MPIMPRIVPLLLGLSLILCNARADHLVIAADPWCPFNCEPGTDKPGFIIEIAQQVFATKGHTLEYKKLPWARAIQEARDGKLTGIAGAYREDAPDFVFPDHEQAVVVEAIFVLKDRNWSYQGSASLAQMSLGIIKDYAYSAEINEYIEKNQGSPDKIQVADGENALEINLRKLLHGRVDALVESESVFWYSAGQLALAGKFKSAGQVHAGPQKAYIAFSPAAPEAKKYAQILSEGMDTLRKSGELARILAKYNLQDWK